MNIKLIRHYYLSAQFPSKLFTLFKPSNESWLDILAILQDSHWHPPIQYRIKLLKAIIKKIDDTQSASDDTLEKYYDYLESLSGGDLHEDFYRLYDLDYLLDSTNSTTDSEGEAFNHQPVKIFEDDSAFVSQGSTGFVTWNAALELAKWLSSTYHSKSLDLTSSNSSTPHWVYELGCGAGMLATFLTRTLQPDQYMATDCHSGVIQRCHKNVEANQLYNIVSPLVRNWMTDVNIIAEDFENCQKNCKTDGILVGSDIVFDAHLLEALTDVIKLFFQHLSTGSAFISSTIRNTETYARFLDLLGQKGLKVTVKHQWTSEDDERYTGQIIQIQL